VTRALSGLLAGFSLPTKDRRLLEAVILPYFANREDFTRILFVGCAWYTRRYRRLFPHKQYSTLDADPAKSGWGAEHHICDSLVRIASHFNDGTLDAILCNGVFGWGLNKKPEVEAAFQGCYQCLRRGGVFMLGWNDIPKRRPFPLESCESLNLFQPYRFEPLDSNCHRTETRNKHVYSFYRR